MQNLYNALKFIHIISFVFMSVPLFNLIVVNERGQLSSKFNFYSDRYMENIIRRGAVRCFVFQGTVLISGVLILLLGPGLRAIWTNWVILTKLLLLLTLFSLLSYVHFVLQPKIEAVLSGIGPDSTIPDNLSNRLKPYRARRKQLATLCLFLVITTIILGIQVYSKMSPPLTVFLILLAGLFSLRVNKTLIRFGWI